MWIVGLRSARRSIVISILLPFSSHSQSFTATSAPAQNWVCITSSADGSRLAAVASYGPLMLSTNSGAIWQLAVTSSKGTEPYRPWVGVAGSSTGERLVAVADSNPVFVSSNYGRSWLQRGPKGSWSCVASSATGDRVAAAQADGPIYVSADGGDNWNAATVPSKRWRTVACSNDGAIIFAGADQGPNYGDLGGIYVSRDHGSTWTATTAPNESWQSIATSADGTRVAAAPYGGRIYVSSDSGSSWTATETPAARWAGLAASSDGSRVTGVAADGIIFTSANGGRDWTPANAPVAQWQSIASSADGLKTVAVIWNLWPDAPGGIYAAQSAPVLSISYTQDFAVVSWPNPSAGFSLQQNSFPPVVPWGPVGIAPAVVDGRQEVRIPLAGADRAVYRLSAE